MNGPENSPQLIVDGIWGINTSAFPPLGTEDNDSEACSTQSPRIFQWIELQWPTVVISLITCSLSPAFSPSHSWDHIPGNPCPQFPVPEFASNLTEHCLPLSTPAMFHNLMWMPKIMDTTEPYIYYVFILNIDTYDKV